MEIIDGFVLKLLNELSGLKSRVYGSDDKILLFIYFLFH